MPGDVGDLIRTYRREYPARGFKRIQDILKGKYLVIVSRKQIRKVLKDAGHLKCLDNHAVDGKFVLGSKSPFSLEWEELKRAKIVFLAEGIIDYLRGDREHPKNRARLPEGKAVRTGTTARCSLKPGVTTWTATTITQSESRQEPAGIKTIPETGPCLQIPKSIS